MNIRRFRSNKGLSLIELIVAMGVASVVLLAMISGAVFLERFLSQWAGRDRLAEECAGLRAELAPHLVSAMAVQAFPESLIVRSARDRRIYRWTDGVFSRDGVPATRQGVTVDSITIRAVTVSPTDMPRFDQPEQSVYSGMLAFRCVVRAASGAKDIVYFKVRNSYAYFKNHP